MPSRNQRVSYSNVGAGVAGASGGTGLLAVINLFPDTDHLKPLLTFAAPTISIAISAFWVFAMRRLDDWIADMTLDGQIQKTEARLAAMKTDGHTSAKIIRATELHLDNMNLVRIELHSSRVRAVIGQ